MKNQYFGDIRDLFKYDLVQRVCMGLNIENFMFIPLLTPDDASNDGNKVRHETAKAGSKNEALINYLCCCMRDGRRSINEISNYFRHYGITTKLYGGYFNHRSRGEYFEGVKNEIPPRSLIFLDPDNGLEIRSSNERHVLFQELQKVYKDMDNQSVLMVIQFFPRENHDDYIKRRCAEIRDRIGTTPLYITDNEVIFFFIAKEARTAELIWKMMENYIDDYPSVQIGPMDWTPNKTTHNNNFQGNKSVSFAPGCLFCERINGKEELVLENEHAVAILDKYPVSHGHTLIIPKRHFSNYFDITTQEQLAVHDLLMESREQLSKIDGSIDGFNVGVNVGEAAGQTIFHCHIHLIPRRRGDVSNPRGGVRGVIPYKQVY